MEYQCIVKLASSETRTGRRTSPKITVTQCVGCLSTCNKHTTVTCVILRAGYWTKLSIEGKGKCKFSPSKSWRRIGGVNVHLHSFLTSTLNEGQWKVRTPAALLPGMETRYPFKRRLVGAKSRAGRFGIGEKPFPSRNSNPGPSSTYPSLYTDCAISDPR